MVATEQDRLISVGELAKLLDVSEQTSRRVLDRGWIPSLRLGAAKVRFAREADALAYRDQRDELRRAVATRAVKILTAQHGMSRAVATAAVAKARGTFR